PWSTASRAATTTVTANCPPSRSRPTNSPTSTPMTTVPASARPVPPVRAVVFDLDGLLIDTEGVFTEAARRLLERRGRVLEAEFMASIMGTPGRDALPRFRDRYGLTESLDALAAEYKGLFVDVLNGGPPPLMPGSLELLGRLERCGIPKAMATSS